eukprot:999598_1
MLSFPKFISIVSVVIGCCFGWIDCDQNRMYWLIPEISAGATWCADEGRLCKGPGKVYYGQLTNWITKDIGDESIPCSNEYFGCDPLIGPKRCYIVKAPTPPPTRRPNYLFGFVQDKTCESYGMNSIYDSIQCQAAAMIIAEEYGLKTDTQFISQTDWVGSDRPTGCSYHQFGNIELWGETTGDCDVNGFGGCFCIKDKFAFVQTGTCESNGMQSIREAAVCKRAADTIAESEGLRTDTQFMDKTHLSGDNLPTGCSYHKFGNIEQWG